VAARRPSRARAWRRAAIIVLLLLVHLPLHGLWRMLGLRSPWPRRFLGGVARAAGMRLSIAGTPLPSHVLYAANHISWMDIPILAYATSARFVAKDEIARWPLIGWLATLNRTVFIAHTRRGSVHTQAEAIRSALDDPAPVALFPEGHTNNRPELDPFHASLFAAVVPAPPGTLVQPVAIDYGVERSVMAWPDDLGAGADAMRILALPGRRAVTLRFCPPIDPAETADRKRIAIAARAAVAQALGDQGMERV
jgi:lyso-ornithine lipid O-acyltransferase